MTVRLSYLNKRWKAGSFEGSKLSGVLFAFAAFNPEYKVVIVVKGL